MNPPECVQRGSDLLESKFKKENGFKSLGRAEPAGIAAHGFLASAVRE